MQQDVTVMRLTMLLVPLMLIQLPLCGLILLGALKMRRLEAYGLAITASILAMLPCHPAFLVGLPIGIWSLVVLLRPETKAAFNRRKSERASASAG